MQFRGISKAPASSTLPFYTQIAIWPLFQPDDMVFHAAEMNVYPLIDRLSPSSTRWHFCRCPRKRYLFSLKIQFRSSLSSFVGDLTAWTGGSTGKILSCQNPPQSRVYFFFPCQAQSLCLALLQLCSRTEFWRWRSGYLWTSGSAMRFLTSNDR